VFEPIKLKKKQMIKIVKIVQDKQNKLWTWID